MNTFSKIFLLVIFVAISCGDKKEKTALEAKKKQEQSFALNHVVGIGKIAPENDIIQLTPLVNGTVLKIYKKENDSVQVGTVILELEHSLEDEKVATINNELATQAASISVEEANVAEMISKLDNAKLTLSRSENLLAKGAETQQTVDDQSTEVKTLLANIKGLKASVSVSKSKLREKKSASKSAQIERDQKFIKSPVKGKILELSVLIGGSVNMQTTFAQIMPEGKTIAICEIDEANADKIVVGQKGWIRSVGALDTISTGVVYFAFSFLKKKSLFTDQSGEKEDRRVRTIKMMLDKSDALMLNTRVECIVEITKK